MEGPGIRFLPPSNMNSTANYTGEIQCSYPGYLMESNYTVLEATCYKENDGSYHWDKPLLKCEGWCMVLTVTSKSTMVEGR